jgi:hypothetical protein
MKITISAIPLIGVITLVSDDGIGAVIKSNSQVKAPDVIEAIVQGTASNPTDIQTGHIVTRHLGSL